MVRSNDSIKGTDGVLATPRLIDARTGGFSGCDAIDQAGAARVNGLSAILPPVAQWQGTAAAVAALSASGSCPLTGPVWGEGDILLGGGGSDTLEGRAGDEIIDGDRYLTTRISYRTNPADPATQTGTTDLMENAAIPATTTNPWGPGTTGMTLQQAVFAGIAHPGNLVAVREILTAAADAAAVDTAVFSGAVVELHDHSARRRQLTVDSNGGADGIDTVRNIEQLRFSDTTQPVVAAPNASLTPATDLAFANQNTGTTSTAQAITVSNTGTLPLVVSGVTVTGTDAASFTATPVAGCASIAPGASCAINVTFAPTTAGPKAATVTISDNAPGSPHTVRLTGTGVAVATVPGAPTNVLAVRANASANVRWTAPLNNGGSPITGYLVRVLDAAGTQVGALRPAAAIANTLVVTGLTNGQAYRFSVSATNAVGTGAASALSAAVTPATVPGAPTGVTATRGNASATVRWTAPASNGGSAITGYSVRVINAAGTQVGALRPAAAAATSLVVTGLTNGQAYRFSVTATNAVGTGAASALSAAVTPATVPGAPVIGTASAGVAGGTINATARWTPPAVHRWVAHHRLPGHRTADERRRSRARHDQLGRATQHRPGADDDPARGRQLPVHRRGHQRSRNRPSLGPVQPGGRPVNRPTTRRVVAVRSPPSGMPGAFEHPLDLAVDQAVGGRQSQPGRPPAARPTWSGCTCATTRRTPPAHTWSSTSAAASRAMPRPCQGAPTTQASSADAAAGRTVACTYPTAGPPSPRRTTQVCHTSSGSPDPATWRSYRRSSSSRLGASRR